MDINEITFGKDRYHEIGSMEYWCAKHIGKGGWAYSTPMTWTGLDDKIWIMYSMFGNTTFCFKNEKDLLWFTMRWA